MHNNIPDILLKKYPQFQQIIEAIELFKKSRKESIKCQFCSSDVKVIENQAEGFLETSCDCGKSKYRMRWEPGKA